VAYRSTLSIPALREALLNPSDAGAVSVQKWAKIFSVLQMVGGSWIFRHICTWLGWLLRN
jgi:hypothetical protein